MPLANTPSDPDAASTQNLRVFVHLAHNKDARRWREDRAAGRLVGVNDETPNGYGRANQMGAHVGFSHSASESPPAKFVRLAMRAALGFDLAHAFKQRKAMADADIIWTHTESQYLAVAALKALGLVRAPLLGQSVWLMDRWPRFSAPRRALIHRLMREVDLLTFHSPLNLARANEVFADRRACIVPYGIPTDAVTKPRLREGLPLRVLAIGNDGDRDWPTLIAAVAAAPEMELRILSGSVNKRLARGSPNIRIGRARTQGELLEAFEQATVACVPLKPNLHASGITVLQEAVLAGLPAVASDAGGLDAYFARDEITFVPPGDVEALRAALRKLAGDPEAALAQAARAQARMTNGTLGADAYVRRHVELSREMLQW